MSSFVSMSACSPEVVLGAMRDDLELSGSAATDDLAFVACLLRRLCGFMCPCPQRAILTAAKRSLAPLGKAAEPLIEQLAPVLDTLLVIGDVIEVSRVGGALFDENRDWLFCGPPAFLELDGRCYVFGIAPDDAPVLAGSLRHRLRHDAIMRFLDDDQDRRIGETLASLGMRRHTAETWLPRASGQSPQRLLEHLRNRLAVDGLEGEIPASEWLAHAGEQYMPYEPRWQPAIHQSGLHIGRATPEFGSRVWFVASLVGGQVERALVLPLADGSDRACDQAWRIQLAVDACNGTPARYRAWPVEDGMKVSVSFPLPFAARRRLVLLGGMRNHNANTGAFWVPNAAWPQAERYLQAELWLLNDQDFAQEMPP